MKFGFAMLISLSNTLANETLKEYALLCCGITR